MSEEKEMTAPNVSIGVDTEQSSIKQTTIAIPQITANIHKSETTHYNPKYKLFPEHF